VSGCTGRLSFAANCSQPRGQPSDSLHSSMRRAVFESSSVPRFILLRPSLNPRLLLRRPMRDLPPPLNEGDVSLFGFARAALLAGFQRLDLRPGDNILLPALICGSLAAPCRAASLEVRFYALDQGLRPCFEHVASQIDRRTRALLAVNYFGFPQNFGAVRQFCAAHGLYFIEDNAHGFLSRLEDCALGTFGDISILSPRKTLGLSNGAALLVNTGKLLRTRGSGLPAQRPYSTLKFLTGTALERAELATGVGVTKFARTAYRSIRPWGGRGLDSGAQEQQSIEGFFDRWSRFTDAIIRRIDPRSLAAIRRKVFTAWLEWFNAGQWPDVKPLHNHLPPGVVPWAFPLVGRNYSRMQAELRERGVESAAWPSSPAPGAPGWDRAPGVLLLPVHELPAFMR
jgi:perosamine synthetase